MPESVTMTDDQVIALAKERGWYWGEADFGHGFRDGWCKGKFAHGGFAADVSELRVILKNDIDAIVQWKIKSDAQWDGLRMWAKIIYNDPDRVDDLTPKPSFNLCQKS